MRHQTDMLGKVFGKLTVIKTYDYYNSHYRYICKCKCGNESVVSGDNLRRGRTTSCGCNKCVNSSQRVIPDNNVESRV